MPPRTPRAVRRSMRLKADVRKKNCKVKSTKENDAEWTTHLLKELVSYPEYFESPIKIKTEIIEKIRSTLCSIGFDKIHGTVKQAISRYVHQRKNCGAILSDGDKKNLAILRERAAGYRGILSDGDKKSLAILRERAAGYRAAQLAPNWMKHLFNELVAYPDYFESNKKSKMATYQNILASLQENGFNKNQKDITSAISRYIYLELEPVSLTSDEDRSNLKILRERATASRKATRQSSGEKITESRKTKTVGSRVTQKKIRRQNKNTNCDYGTVTDDEPDPDNMDFDVPVASEKMFTRAQVEKKIKKAVETVEQKNKELREQLLKARKEIAELREKYGEAKSDRKPDVVDLKAAAFTVADEGEMHPSIKGLLELKGAVIGPEKYTITDLIGYGSFGAVFRAVEEETKKAHALKCVIDVDISKPELAMMDKLRSDGPDNRFLCLPISSFEARVNEIDFRGFVMELMQMDLFTLRFGDDNLKRKFPPSTVLSFLGQLFSALAFVNKKGFIHCDLKPENVVIKNYDVEMKNGVHFIRNMEIRLIDMNSVSSIADVPCEICQSECYRAPEVILGAFYDERIDSFSAGLMAVELLADSPIDVDEYDAKDVLKASDHLAQIEHFVGENIPHKMWDEGVLENIFPVKKIGSRFTPTLAGVFKHMETSTSTTALQYYLPRLLKISPDERPTPSEAAEYFKDTIPHH